jgi:secretion/DNA translocation related TadE-like protein
MNRSTDRGSACIWVLTVSAVLIAAALVVATRGGAVLARHRAESAADAAALAAAAQIGVGPDPCQAAGRLAAANHARISRCTLHLAGDQRSGQVEVSVRLGIHLLILGQTTVEARAWAQRDPAPATSTP